MRRATNRLESPAGAILICLGAIGLGCASPATDRSPGAPGSGGAGAAGAVASSGGGAAAPAGSGGSPSGATGGSLAATGGLSGSGGRTSPTQPGSGGEAGGAAGGPAGGASVAAMGGRAAPSGSGGGMAGRAGGSGGSASGGGGTSVPRDAGAPTGGSASTPPGGDAGLPGADAGATSDPRAVLGSGPVASSTQHLDIGVHDPSMIWNGKSYVLFATGGSLAVRTSPDALTWSNAGQVFPSVPAWIAATIGAQPEGIWAPDISYFGGKFHLYYAGSTFGSRTSVIGQATTPSLDPSSPSYRWTDLGLVVQSSSATNYNAIDPNVSFDATGAPWLSFGSFWDGIRLRKLDPATGMPASDDTTLYAIASRGGGAIEAPSIVAHGGFYYLFVSFDACCMKTQSTYRTMAGRATRITGPYVDKSGKNMMQGGGDQLLATSGRYIGPGGGTAWKNGDVYLYTFHYYDGQDSGVSKLQIRPIVFGADDWPTLGTPLFP